MTGRESLELVEEPRRGLVEQIRFSMKLYGWRGTLGRVLLLQEERARFARRGDEGGRSLRRRLLADLDRAYRGLPCLHSPGQFLIIADYILNAAVPGDIVECGAYKGGSTAQLSLIARDTGRKLIVCDSFQGLPEPEASEETMRGYRDAPGLRFRAGDFAGSLEEVRSSVQRFGSIESCTFVPGFFKDSLPGLDVTAAFVVADVDLISSTRDCLAALWPRLQSGGTWFTHDAHSDDYLRGMLDAEWWQRALGASPPVLFGGGSGLSSIAPSLACMHKR